MDSSVKKEPSNFIGSLITGVVAIGYITLIIGMFGFAAAGLKTTMDSTVLYHEKIAIRAAMEEQTMIKGIEDSKYDTLQDISVTTSDKLTEIQQPVKIIKSVNFVNTENNLKLAKIKVEIEAPNITMGDNNYSRVLNNTYLIAKAQDGRSIIVKN